jgi:hypothetical protein
MGEKAKESEQVMKARKKLERKIQEQNRHMTSEALRQMALLIEQQLVRHARERISLKSKEISLFDENRHSAKVKSKFVTQLLGTLKGPTKKSLKGRVKTAW